MAFFSLLFFFIICTHLFFSWSVCSLSVHETYLKYKKSVCHVYLERPRGQRNSIYLCCAVGRQYDEIKTVDSVTIFIHIYQVQCMPGVAVVII